MNIVKGSIVRVKAGHDKNGYFVVLEREGKFAYIADGRRRKVEAPKKKSVIHLAPTNTVIEGSIETNPQAKRILNDFLKNGG